MSNAWINAPNSSIGVGSCSVLCYVCIMSAWTIFWVVSMLIAIVACKVWRSWQEWWTLTSEWLTMSRIWRILLITTPIILIECPSIIAIVIEMIIASIGPTATSSFSSPFVWIRLFIAIRVLILYGMISNQCSTGREWEKRHSFLQLIFLNHKIIEVVKGEIWTKMKRGCKLLVLKA